MRVSCSDNDRLRMMAHDRHKTVILSIHQPSSGIFNTFDKVIVSQIDTWIIIVIDANMIRYYYYQEENVFISVLALT